MFNGAHGAGWRAGITRQPIIHHRDGTRTLAAPACPFTKWWQALHHAAWHSGFYEGRMEAHARWILRYKGRV